MSQLSHPDDGLQLSQGGDGPQLSQGSNCSQLSQSSDGWTGYSFSQEVDKILSESNDGSPASSQDSDAGTPTSSQPDGPQPNGSCLNESEPSSQGAIGWQLDPHGAASQDRPVPRCHRCGVNASSQCTHVSGARTASQGTVGASQESIGSFQDAADASQESPSSSQETIHASSQEEGYDYYSRSSSPEVEPAWTSSQQEPPSQGEQLWSSSQGEPLWSSSQGEQPWPSSQDRREAAEYEPENPFPASQLGTGSPFPSSQPKAGGAHGYSYGYRPPPCSQPRVPLYSNSQPDEDDENNSYWSDAAAARRAISRGGFGSSQ
ncbi:hypothetical protein HDZ31DRAFT_60955 [Schizophyllum fasciatum]